MVPQSVPSVAPNLRSGTECFEVGSEEGEQPFVGEGSRIEEGLYYEAVGEGGQGCHQVIRIAWRQVAV